MLDLATLHVRNWETHYQRWSDRLDKWTRGHGKIEDFPRAYATGPDFDGTIYRAPDSPFEQQCFTGADLVKHRGYQVAPAVSPCFD